MNAASLATFTAWVEAQKAQALEGMNTTSGDAFGKHCDAFIELTKASNVLFKFADVLREQGRAGSDKEREGHP